MKYHLSWPVSKHTAITTTTTAWLLFLMGLALGQVQPLEITSRVVNWPPQGWSQSDTAEVRLVFGGFYSPPTTGIASKIATNQGLSVGFSKNPTIPNEAWKSLLQVLLPGGDCDFKPTLSTLGARAAVPAILVYKAGETRPLGYLSIESRNIDGGKTFGEAAFLVYLDQDVQVRGSGNCQGVPHNLNLNLKSGWNQIGIKAELSPISTATSIEITSLNRSNLAFRFNKVQR